MDCPKPLSDLHVYPNVAALIWTVGGVVGLILRAVIWRTFRADLEYGYKSGASTAAIAVGKRTLETNLVHLFIKLVITISGVAGMMTESQTAAGYPPTAFATTILVVLLSVPWLLNWDAYRELTNRKQLEKPL